MENTMTKGAVRLRVPEIMMERNITVADLARMTGLTYNSASSISRGHYDRIGMETIEALCRGLGVTPGELFAYSPLNDSEG